MGLIRLLSYLVIGWLVWRTVKRWYAGYQQSAGKQANKQPNPALSTRIVKCEHCEVHLPESDAVVHDGHWFCNQQHKHAWLGKS